MKPEIPVESLPTFNMLNAAFPDGLTEDVYFPVIHYLYDHMSDRQLARLLSLFTGRDYPTIFLRDIAKVCNLDVAMRTNEVVYKKLIDNGYEKWIEED